jgi:RES domain-containing protein
MITAHRISHQQFIKDLEGTGAKKFGGRWNPQGVACLYCSANLSLAVLEKLVHAQGRSDLINLATVAFIIPATSLLYTIDVKKLQKDWLTNVAYTQWMGKQILEDSSYAGFIVPSIIVEEEKNIVLNPLSPDFSKIAVKPAKAFSLDSRLVTHYQ